MPKDPADILLSTSQARALATLRSELATDYAKAEIKSWDITQPTADEDPQLANYIFCSAVIGYPGDDDNYRRALRSRITYVISPRGRVERWSDKAFRKD